MLEVEKWVLLWVFIICTIFDERYYDNLPGGLLRAFGRGFGHNVKLFVYPANNVENGELYSLSNIRIASHLLGLLQYMKDNNKMGAIEGYNHRLLHILSDDVLSKIKAGGSSWEDDVPEEVAKAIKQFELFGYMNNKKTWVAT